MLKILSVFYWLSALLTLLFTWFGVLMIAADSRKLDWLMMVTGSGITIFFILGALEAWRNAPQKSLLRKAVLIGPSVIILLAVVYIFIRL